MSVPSHAKGILLKKNLPLALRSANKLSSGVGSSVAELELIRRYPESFYNTFSLSKPNGKKRIITPPIPRLRCIQRQLLDLLEPLFPMPSYVCGGVKGRSIKAHASKHVEKYLVYTMDIRNFFQSTRLDLVTNALGQTIPSDVAKLISEICFYDGGLPQGSPMSMFLANISFRKADKQFHRLCRKHHLQYSRYVDDIAVSGDKDFRSLESAFVYAVEMLGYHVADEKMHWRFRNQRQIVTGLLVNDVMKPTQEYRKDIMCMIRNCIRHGPEIIANEIGLTVQQLKRRLNGRVRFVEEYDMRFGKKVRGLLCRIWAGSSKNT